MAWWKKLLLTPVILAAIVFGAPIVALGVACWLVGSIGIVLLFSLVWIPRGQRFLVVYSDSAQWKSYFEAEVLPTFGSSARVLNLSRDGGRKKWWHLDWVAYRYCAGYRFYDAYMQSKKGKTAALDKAKAQLYFWRPQNA